MSDPASNVGIEDVLASVRRLVSTERPKRPDPDLNADAPAERVEALVLTPDFRVSQDEDTSVDDSGSAAEQTDPPEDAALAADLASADPAPGETEDLAETSAQSEEAEALGALILEAADSAEIDMPEAPEAELPEAELSEAELPEAEEPEAPEAAHLTDETILAEEAADAGEETGSADAAPEAVQPDEDTAEGRVMSLEDRIAQLEAAVLAHASQDYEPDGSEDLTQHRPDYIPGVEVNEDAALHDLPDAELAARFAEVDLAENILDHLDAAGDAEPPKRNDATAAIDAYMARVPDADAGDTEALGEAETDDIVAEAVEAAVAEADPAENDTDAPEQDMEAPEEDAHVQTDTDEDSADETAMAAPEADADPDTQDAGEMEAPSGDDEPVAAPKLDGVGWAREGAIAAALEEALTRVASETAAAAARSGRKADDSDAQPDDTPQEDVTAAADDDVVLELGHSVEAAEEAAGLTVVDGGSGEDGALDDDLNAFAPDSGDSLETQDQSEVAEADDGDEIDFDAWEEIYTPRAAEGTPDESDASESERRAHRLFRPKPSLVRDADDEEDAPTEASKEGWDDRLYHLDSGGDLGGIDFSDDAQELDEETLRDMVAEIVREELQGALGERITRNVRKLVRREIMRALSVREFD